MTEPTRLRLLLIKLAGTFAVCKLDKAAAIPNWATSGDIFSVTRTVKDEVRGGIAFRPEKRTWVRISGKVKVLAAHTVAYEDGSEVRLDGMMEAPELEQKGLIDGKFYPCGKDAAEFLRKLIGDRSVKCIVHRENVDGKKMRGGSAFVGETCLNIEMVRNGWAISDHEGMDGFEILAREQAWLMAGDIRRPGPLANRRPAAG